MKITIRKATDEDQQFIVSLVARLTEFGPPPWRNPAKMNAVDADVMSDRLKNPSPNADVFVAEDEKGARLGYMHMRTSTDYYAPGELHAHIADLVVAADGEGKGVGKALMAHAEDWARSRGYTQVTLSVFTQNTRARELYKRMGYGEDIILYVKDLE